MNISDRIRVLCARLNISQAELARRIGHSPQGFSAKMKRESFTIEEVERVADAAGAFFKYGFSFKNGEEI